jgi:hypothetical protein
MGTASPEEMVQRLMSDYKAGALDEVDAQDELMSQRQAALLGSAGGISFTVRLRQLTGPCCSRAVQLARQAVWAPR